MTECHIRRVVVSGHCPLMVGNKSPCGRMIISNRVVGRPGGHLGWRRSSGITDKGDGSVNREGQSQQNKNGAVSIVYRSYRQDVRKTKCAITMCVDERSDTLFEETLCPTDGCIERPKPSWVSFWERVRYVSHNKRNPPTLVQPFYKDPFKDHLFSNSTCP